MAGLTLPHFKTYCKAKITNAVLHWEEESIGVNLSQLGLGTGFLDMTPKIVNQQHNSQREKKRGKLNIVKIKTFVLPCILSRD